MFVKDKEELTIKETAQRFDIGVTSVVRQSSRLEPCLTRNKPATKIAGSINANVFFAWVEQDLLPKLPPNCLIVMDNATFHKRTDIQKIIQDAGHTLDYLPPYSPDLNPIEYKWAQSKAIITRGY